MVPVRIADTRLGEPVAFPTPKARLTAGQTLQIPVAGTNGIPGTAAGVSLNVTAVNPAAPGFLTVYPCGNPRPNASNLNYTPGDIIPNAVLTSLGTGGTVCIYTHATTDIITDLNGWLN
jgi:hypothetical protein